MAKSQKFELQFISSIDLTQLQRDLNQMQTSLSRLKLTDSLQTDFDDLFRRLNREIKNFTVASSQQFTSMGDVRKLEQGYQKIQNLFDIIQRRIKEINAQKISLNLTGDAAKKFQELSSQIENTEKAISSLRNNYKQLENSLKDLNFNSPGIKDSLKEILQLAQNGEDYSKQLEELKKNLANTDSAYQANERALQKYRNAISKAQIDWQLATDNAKNLETQIESLKRELSEKFGNKGVDELKQSISEAETALRNFTTEFRSIKGNQKARITDVEEYQRLKANIDQARESLRQYNQTAGEISKLQKQIDSVKQFEIRIQQLNKTIDLAIQQQREADAQSVDSFLVDLDNVEKGKSSLTDLIQRYQDLRNEQEKIKSDNIKESGEALTEAEISARSAERAIENTGAAVSDLGNKADSIRNITQEFAGLYNRAVDFFSLSNSFELLGDAVRFAYESVKELDAAMTDIAVVTDFDLGEVWETVPEYTDLANELGTTILGAYDTAKLYYQQGLDTNEVMEVSAETMKMARIANMDYAQATDFMTAAVKGFKLEVTDATRVNDVFSELAAITAADTYEIASALTRTASIANSAGMALETTSAFLTQMIETTR